MVEKSEQTLFHKFAPYYDKMLDWPRRLEREGPFFSKIFTENNTLRILDAASGTGRHALLFARWGYYVAACDISPEMIDLARKNGAEAALA